MPSPESRLCDDCDIRTLARPEAVQKCAEYAQEAVHQWFVGDPTVSLQDKLRDEVRYADDIFSSCEVVALEGCMSEHSSLRCDNLNP